VGRARGNQTLGATARNSKSARDQGRTAEEGLARRRRAPTGSDQSHEDGANRGVSWNDTHFFLKFLDRHFREFTDAWTRKSVWMDCAFPTQGGAITIGQHTATHCNTLQHTAAITIGRRYIPW